MNEERSKKKVSSGETDRCLLRLLTLLATTVDSSTKDRVDDGSRVAHVGGREVAQRSFPEEGNATQGRLRLGLARHCRKCGG